MKIGIPRALLYYFFEDLWLNFFNNLNIEVIVSPPTNKEIVKKGIALSIDEGCYSSKVFIGHVEYLLDKCDMIFIPRIENSAIREEYCTRIFGLYDLAKSTFPQANILHAEVNYLYRKKESSAFVEIGTQLGKSEEESLQAYKNAAAVAKETRSEKVRLQEELLQSEGPKILIVSHPYNAYDASIGKEITDFFAENNIKVAFADLIEPKTAKSKTREQYGKRIYWKVSAEQLGALELYKDLVDGIVLISTFPCGPDSLINELVIHTIKDKPILSLIIDEQDGSAGVITRLESFTDIIMAKRKVAMKQ